MGNKFRIQKEKHQAWSRHDVLVFVDNYKTFCVSGRSYVTPDKLIDIFDARVIHFTSSKHGHESVT